MKWLTASERYRPVCQGWLVFQQDKCLNLFCVFPLILSASLVEDFYTPLHWAVFAQQEKSIFFASLISRIHLAIECLFCHLVSIIFNTDFLSMTLAGENKQLLPELFLISPLKLH